MSRIITALTLFSLLAASTANATMQNLVTYSAPGAGISIDAVGLGDHQEGLIQAVLPTGAIVQQAFLYSASVWSSSLSNVVFGGTTLVSDGSSRLDVGASDANPASENRWDVTSIVQAQVGGGSGTFNFTVTEQGYLDGEILAVLYMVPLMPVTTAFLFDGELATGGDSVNIYLADPVNNSDPNFQATMSLGISFGFQPSAQSSQININGGRLTSSAGGQDDGFDDNGGLITAGGVGDSLANPVNPFATGTSGVRYDDELYTLDDFLANGTTVINMNTINPSNDDNVFFMAATILGEADIVPIDPVPEPSTLLLLGGGLLGLGLLRKRGKI